MSPLFLIGSLSLKTNVFWVWRGGYHRENYKQEERKSHLVIRELSVLTGLRQLMAWLFVVVCLEKKKCSCELDPSSFWSGVNLTCNQPVLINRFNVLLPCLSYSMCCFPIIVALARHYLGPSLSFPNSTVCTSLDLNIISRSAVTSRKSREFHSVTLTPVMCIVL